MNSRPASVLLTPEMGVLFGIILGLANVLNPRCLESPRSRDTWVRLSEQALFIMIYTSDLPCSGIPRKNVSRGTGHGSENKSFDEKLKKKNEKLKKNYITKLN